MRILTVIFRGLLVVALTLGALVLGAPAADAIEAGPQCVDGILVGNQCVIEGDTDAGDVCPALEDEDGNCYTNILATLTCPDGSPPTALGCALAVPDVEGEPVCQEPYTLDDDGTCTLEVPAEETFTCSGGFYDEAFATCMEDYGPPERPLECPDLEDAEGCYTTEPAVSFCPPSTTEFESGCYEEVERETIPTTCEDLGFDTTVAFDGETRCGFSGIVEIDCEFGYQIFEDTCREDLELQPCQEYFEEADYFVGESDGLCYDIFIDISDGCPPGFELNLSFEACTRLLGPASDCPLDYLFDGEVCFTTFTGTVLCTDEWPEFLGFDAGDAYCWFDAGPLGDSSVCPAEEIDGFCGSLVPYEFGCFFGTLISETECRIPQIPEPGLAFCDLGFYDAALDSCIDDFGPPEFGFFCFEGIDLGSTCLITGPAPTREPSCGGALGEPGACFIYVPPTPTCPDDAISGPDDGLFCQVPVERVGEGCAEGFGLVDGRCLMFVEPVWFCAGQEVTINMTLGDPGVGTPGPDVILGTTGPDLINAGGGNDLVCALAGADVVNGGSGRDVVYGGADGDTLNGDSGRDFLYGESGEDELNGGQGGDDLLGGADNDVVNGGRGRDSVRGGSGNDVLNGDGGRDVLIGSSGDDMLFGGGGRDFLKAGSGIDTCDGQQRADSFRNCETIVDP